MDEPRAVREASGSSSGPRQSTARYEDQGVEDNSPTKNDRKDARVISQLIKDGRYSVPHIPEDIYADLRVGMNERDRLSEDLKRVQARIHNWLDRFFPEFTTVFKDWEGKAALVCLHEFPCPEDVQQKTAAEIVQKWRVGGISRGVGKSKANHLREMAEQSIGLTEGLQMAHHELRILLAQYDLYQEQLGLLMAEIEQWVSTIPGAEQMMSVPGVGLVTVAGFLAEVGDQTDSKAGRTQPQGEQFRETQRTNQDQ